MSTAGSSQSGLDCQVIIVGGGLTGMPLALALADAGLSVTLIDQLDPATVRRPKFDGRVTSLAYGSQQMMAALQLWPDLADRAEAILDIRVADDSSPLFLHFDHQDVGARPFGFMVENRHLRQALQKRLRATKQIQWLAPARVCEMTRTAAMASVRLEDGRTLRAQLLVAADGRQSPLRQWAAIPTLSWRYQQTAIVSTLSHTRPHCGVAKEHFLPGGPFALLPMRNQQSSMVWSESHELAKALLALDRPALLAEIRQRAGDGLGDLDLAGPIWSYPLGLSHAERYIDHRLVLVGDAAHAMHPLAGQGLNLGFRDVGFLAECLVAAQRLGLDLGSQAVLSDYDRQRHWDAFTMLVMTDGLNRIFTNPLPIVKWGRRLGLGLVNRSRLAKGFFERRASAMTGQLPKLMRGEALR